MNKTTILIIAAALLAACTQGEAPEPTTELPVRYASADLADIGRYGRQPAMPVLEKRQRKTLRA